MPYKRVEIKVEDLLFSKGKITHICHTTPLRECTWSSNH